MENHRTTVADQSPTSNWPVTDQSPTSHWPVTDQSPTSRRLQRTSPRPTGHREVFDACTKYHSMTKIIKMVVEMSSISHRSTKTSPKVDKTITRWSATFRRLPKTTKYFEVAGGRRLVRTLSVTGPLIKSSPGAYSRRVTLCHFYLRVFLHCILSVENWELNDWERFLTFIPKVSLFVDRGWIVKLLLQCYCPPNIVYVVPTWDTLVNGNEVV